MIMRYLQLALNVFSIIGKFFSKDKQKRERSEEEAEEMERRDVINMSRRKKVQNMKEKLRNAWKERKTRTKEDL